MLKNVWVYQYLSIYMGVFLSICMW